MDPDRDGISGEPNVVRNPESGQTELGRFGWKAHISTLRLFAGDAYLNEMGIPNPTFPRGNVPARQEILSDCDPLPEADGQREDDGSGVDGFTDFMRFLSPLENRAVVAEARSGRQVFGQIGCAGCHVPAMRTGNDPVGALRGQTVALWSDLLLHDMGPDLADGIEMEAAGGIPNGGWIVRGLRDCGVENDITAPHDFLTSGSYSIIVMPAHSRTRGPRRQTEVVLPVN
jgi:CxxC motif-containing protein (DUF1111 family)